MTTFHMPDSWYDPPDDEVTYCAACGQNGEDAYESDDDDTVLMCGGCDNVYEARDPDWDYDPDRGRDDFD